MVYSVCICQNYVQEIEYFFSPLFAIIITLKQNFHNYDTEISRTKDKKAKPYPFLSKFKLSLHRGPIYHWKPKLYVNNKSSNYTASVVEITV